MAAIINDPQKEANGNGNHVTGGILLFHRHSINLFPIGEIHFPLTSANPGPVPTAVAQETFFIVQTQTNTSQFPNDTSSIVKVIALPNG